MHDTLPAMEQMSVAVLDISKNAGDAAANSDNMRNTATDGQNIVEQVVSSISQVQKNSMDLRADMEKLSDEAQSINRIMTVISDIADQTNLLALNAAIEAARAGDAGRGFAVVADEVRKLAEKTMSATTEVGAAIENIQQSTRRNMEHVDRAVTSIEEVTGLAHTSGDRLRDIVEITTLSTDMVRAIATASEQQSASTAQINETVEAVDNTLKDVAMTIAAANNAAKQLNGQMSEIRQLMDRLKSGSLPSRPVLQPLRPLAGEVFCVRRCPANAAGRSACSPLDRLFFGIISSLIESPWRQPRCRRRKSGTPAYPAPQGGSFFAGKAA